MQQSIGYSTNEMKDSLKAQLHFQIFLEKLLIDQEEALNYAKDSELAKEIIYVDLDDELAPQQRVFQV